MKPISAHITSLGGRKFALVLGCGIVNAILLWFGKLTPEAYSTVTLATVGTYIVGNVAQRVKGPQ